MKFFSVVMIALVATFSLEAQQIQLKESDQPMVLPDGKVGTANIEGNPFLNEAYVPVVLNNLDGSKMLVDEGRFNAYAQKIEVVKDGDKIWVNDHKLAGFTLKPNGKSQKYVRFIIEQESRYLEELVADQKPLLMLSMISVIEPKKQDNTSYNRETTGTFKYGKPKISYYTLRDGKLTLIPTSKKKFLEFLPARYKSKMEKKIKTDKLKTNNSKDLRTLFVYYNSLLVS